MSVAAMPRPAASVVAVLLLTFANVFLVSCQQGSPKNIETFYPSAPPPSPVPLPPPPIAVLPPPSPPFVSPLQPPPPPTKSSSSHSSTIVKAVLGTAAGSIAISGLVFFLIRQHSKKKLENESTGGGGGGEGGGGGLPVIARDDFHRLDGNVKGLIVDDNGLDVLYWRRLQSSNAMNGFRKEVMRGQEEGGRNVSAAIGVGSRRKNPDPIQKVPLLGEKPANSFNQIQLVRDAEMLASVGQLPLTNSPPPPPTPPPPPPPTPGTARSNSPEAEVRTALAIPGAKSDSSAPPPPPPPPAPKSSNARAPPPPPPLKAGSSALAASKVLPPLPKGKPGEQPDKNHLETGQVKLKPLHWDKVNTNADHSMVWNKIGRGSFQFDDDLMEALFGTVATNRKSPTANGDPRTSGNLSPGPSGQIFLLDPRKSQNIAIVLKSLSVSRKEIIDALSQGRGLDAETIEKLNRIAPTKEEESRILEFGGESTRLADAESFLYHILKAMPSAFTRFNAMLFRCNYQSDVSQLKETLQTLQLACKELRTRGIFMKLLEAILKAGNRMNQGTSRGNAQAFNLTSLRKLSDVKSTDGKTTLLNFVVEEVVRAEGKRCVTNRDRGLSRSSSQGSTTSMISEPSKPKEDREKEYMMLGLPLVGGMSSEFLNVKRAAAIDYESFSTSCESLSARASEIRLLLSEGCSEGGLFAREMEGFLRSAEEELSTLRRLQAEAMDLIRSTTEYYQSGAARQKGGNPLQFFLIVKDFLVMVDQACVEITRKQQQKAKTRTNSGTGSSSPESPPKRPGLRFPVLSPDFFVQKSGSSGSSESET
ncbi:hypothetical protein MLD38_008514 [Melastoma candidum]|uniref:Uncharacterized protein n=1 Tax=Melastoma candidum TaxID=119954 RepID=A0ACB9RYA3_9MYRT|nr:hypothetical protein MLD38_008514 [Melastoma candidum]